MANHASRIRRHLTKWNGKRQHGAWKRRADVFVRRKTVSKALRSPRQSDRSKGECGVVGKSGASLRARESRLAAVRRPTADHGGQQALRQVPKALAGR